ncbi:MAG: hypothetical protein P8100_04310 [bacterium]
MRTGILAIITLSVLLMTSCSGGKQLSQNKDRAESAFKSGNYTEALRYYEEVIHAYESGNDATNCPVYARAAEAAGKIGQTEKAIRYLEADRYTRFANADTWFDLSLLYREIDNLSKEIEALEEYLRRYPEADKADLARTRLFDIFMETGNWEYARDQWNVIPESSRESRIEDCFVFNRALENDHACDTLAIQLLKSDDENQLALEWMAKKLFWEAERLYQDEMKAYNENRTNKQYRQLLKALDRVTADFKTSLGYFKKLYDADPLPEYAKYLGDIYNRLDDPKKAEFYYQKSSGNQ